MSMLYSSCLTKARTVYGVLFILTAIFSASVFAQDVLPIADTHVHYSHDSVEMTPPERVIELMRSAGLKFAMVSSSDDNGTQLLSELAPELIVPSLRPYRRRGETDSWFTDPEALEYVERLLENNRYASIGEFHLFGDTAELPIPRSIVKLAEKYNLLLHAHSDADAIERLLAQSETVKVIWAHSGFDSPADIANMLEKHDRLWADLAFRHEVGSGGELSTEWRELFESYPDRMMLGTDTYTPERMFFIPEHAESSRAWLSTLPNELAENIAWRNAFELIMPIWSENQLSDDKSVSSNAKNACDISNDSNMLIVENDQYTAVIKNLEPVKVSEPLTVLVTVCGEVSAIDEFTLDASMPVHGHGTNYQPNIKKVESESDYALYQVEGIVLHMPGKWQWDMEIGSTSGKQTLNHEFVVQ